MDEKSHKTDGIADRILSLSSAKVLKREVYEATNEARDVIAQAHERARQIVEEAERNRDSIREAAELEGRAQGLAAWNQILAQASQRADVLAKNWEETMLRLSVRIAEKIIGEQLKLHPDTILDIVREVLKGARPGRRLAIQVNDIDAQLLRARLDRLKECTAISSEIEIVPSASIPRGGCVIESEVGIIDARLETQLKCLEDALIRGVSAD